MQGPMSVLNVLTIPPGATSTQQRLVIDGVRGAIFVYANGGPGGALVGSWASSAGTDPYGNSYPAGFQTTAGNSTIEGNNFILNANGLFIYNQATSGSTTLTFNSGTGQWTAPAAVTSVIAECWGAGAGGANGAFQTAGGGGEYAKEPNLAVTPGNKYTYVVGGGGTGGAASASVAHLGTNGANSTFTGDAKTVTANGGQAATGAPNGGLGGSGSNNSTHFSGGAGGNVTGGGVTGPGGTGGGSSAGTAAAGSNGHTNTGGTPGNGGTAPLGGGDGGKGGKGGTSGTTDGTAGAMPGGGGGGGGDNTNTNFLQAGGNGSNGQVRLTYTPTPSGLALVSSICGIATTDPSLGVSCPVGVTVYNTSAQTVQANLQSGNLAFIDTVNAATSPGLIGLATVTATNDSLQLNSPAASVSVVQAFFSLQGVPAGSGPPLAILANAGLWIKTGVAAPAIPASGMVIYQGTGGDLNFTPSAANSVVLRNSNLQFLGGPAVGTPGSGVAIGTDGGSLRMSYTPNSGHNTNFSGADLATFPNTTVTQATLTNLASATIPANDAEVGSVYELEVWGAGTWGSTAQQLNFQTTIGGVADSGGNVTIAASQFPTSQNFRFHVVAFMVVNTTGSTGNCKVGVRGEVTSNNSTIATVTGTAQATISFVFCDDTGLPAFNSTVSRVLALQAFWGSTTGAPTLTSRVAIFKRVN